MMKTVLMALPLAVFPTLVAAEPGSGTDLYRVLNQVEAMQRDGRWDELLRAQAQPQAVGTLNRNATRTPRSAAPPPRARRAH